MQKHTIFAAAFTLFGTMLATAILLPQGVHAQEATAQPADKGPAITAYTVKAGDYLEAIAEEHQVSWPSIYELNKAIENPDVIFPDQKLDIPNKDVPLTRVVPQESTLEIPADYNPQPTAVQPAKPQAAPTIQQRIAAPAAPRAVVSQAPAVQAAPQPQAQVAAGVPGLGLVLGRPYVYGGTSPATGFDCSGLTQFLAAQRGISIPRTSGAQYSALRHIPLGSALPGDIVVFNMGHVGTYLGGGQVVHALNPAQGIRVENVQSAIKYNGFLTALAVGH